MNMIRETKEVLWYQKAGGNKAKNFGIYEMNLHRSEFSEHVQLYRAETCRARDSIQERYAYGEGREEGNLG